MMNIVSIYTDTPVNHVLSDKRLGRSGLVFGTINSLASQYGIKLVDKGDCIELTGPKKRIQIVAEKLHFAGASYWE